LKDSDECLACSGMSVGKLVVPCSGERRSAGRTEASIAASAADDSAEELDSRPISPTLSCASCPSLSIIRASAWDKVADAIDTNICPSAADPELLCGGADSDSSRELSIVWL
jgi:hypothetical protein